MSVSAFGVEHTTISKRKNDDVKNSAIASGGGVVAGLGLLGGGIPGVKSNSEVLENMRDPKKTWGQRTGAGLASMRGGIFGYRTDAHQKALNRLTDNYNYFHGKDASRTGMHQRGREAGKLAPEKQVITHLKRGRKISNALLVGGAGATYYGIKQMKDKKKPPKNLRYEFGKSERSDRFYGSLLGAGGTAAGSSMLAESIMRGQQKRWAQKKEASLKEAEKIIPRMKVDTASDDIKNNPNKYLTGKSKQEAYDAGFQRGHATQYKYFAHTYGKNAKYARAVRNPALITAGVGAAGLGLSRTEKRKSLKKPKLRWE